jgi:hypothetical protein
MRRDLTVKEKLEKYAIIVSKLEENNIVFLGLDGGYTVVTHPLGHPDLRIGQSTAAWEHSTINEVVEGLINMHNSALERCGKTPVASDFKRSQFLGGVITEQQYKRSGKVLIKESLFIRRPQMGTYDATNGRRDELVALLKSKGVECISEPHYNHVRIHTNDLLEEVGNILKEFGMPMVSDEDSYAFGKGPRASVSLGLKGGDAPPSAPPGAMY